MRSSKQIFELIDSVARSDENIRAVLLNGSRANPNAKADIFQDYDIVYLVKNVSEYANKPTWAAQFGEIMIMQMPETMQDPPPLDNGSFSYLMQFTDGNRIDLTIFPIDRYNELLFDSQTVVLLDKDELFGNLPKPSEDSYLPQKPTDKQFQDCCNEFYWLAPYVAKGLYRNDVGYYKHFLDVGMRGQLFKMLDWYIGEKHNYKKAPGKFGKNYQKLLGEELYELFLAGYASAVASANRQALYATMQLFERSAKELASRLGYEFPIVEVKSLKAYLKRVEQLKKDATDY